MKFDQLIENYMRNIKRGKEFGTAGAGKAGPIKSKKDKAKSPKKQRQDWKKQERDY